MEWLILFYYSLFSNQNFILIFQHILLWPAQEDIAKCFRSVKNLPNACKGSSIYDIHKIWPVFWPLYPHHLQKWTIDLCRNFAKGSKWQFLKNWVFVGNFIFGMYGTASWFDFTVLVPRVFFFFFLIGQAKRSK